METFDDAMNFINKIEQRVCFLRREDEERIHFILAMYHEPDEIAKRISELLNVNYECIFDLL